MIASKRPAGMSALAREVRHWVQAEAGDRELKRRVAAALDEIKEFVGKRTFDLEKRKSRLIQTPGFKDETRAMEAALGKIHQLLAGGKNISRIFVAIDRFLDTYKGDEALERDHIRTQLADANDDFILRFHHSIRGTRLAQLLDVFYFMPSSCWTSRGVAKRNFRSPSAAELTKLLEEFRQRGVDVDGIDTVRLAAMARIKLGITPRMHFHLMPANKLAEKLTSEEIIARFAAAEPPPDEAFCRTTAGIAANIRRWSCECFGSTVVAAPPEIEAEMLQLVYLATDSIRISGTEKERSADYLWLLATVVGSGHGVLKEVLSGIADGSIGHPSVRERLVGAKTYLDGISVKADGILAARWAEAKEELRSLIARADAIAAQSTHHYRDYTELEDLKEKRSDVVKSLIKLSDSIQLIEPSVLESLTSPATSAGRSNDEQGRGRSQAGLRDRNYRISGETKATALQELEKLRLLILRITEVSRRGFADSGPPASQLSQRTGERLAGKTSDGVEIAALPAADLHAKLCGTLRKASFNLREFKSKVEGVRRRPLKGELQHAVNILHEKTKKAVDACDGSDLDTSDHAQAILFSDGVLPLLREIMAALTNVVARMNSAKVTPAEKQPLTTLMYGVKLRLGDDLRDVERLRTELLGRSSGTLTAPCADTEGATEDAAIGLTAEISRTTEETGMSPTAPAEAAKAAQEAAFRAPVVKKIAGLVASVSESLKPVKAQMTSLNSALGSNPSDNQHIFAAATALQSEITTAQDVLTANLMQIKTLAAGVDLTTDGYVEKFDRWQGPLATLEQETGRLIKSMAAVADIERAAAEAAALEKRIDDTLNPPSGEWIKAEPFIPVRQRCVDALAAIADLLTQLRGAANSLAAARSLKWKMLPAASRSVGRLWSDFTASEQGLRDTQARIETIHNRFKYDRPFQR